MDKNKLMDIAENMIEQMGAENLLDELLLAMDVDELRANLEYIDSVNDLYNFEEEEF